MGSKIDHGQTFLCQKCTGEHDGSFVHIDNDITGDPENAKARWALFNSRTGDMVALEINDRAMMAYAVDLEHIIRLVDKLLTDRFLLLRFYIGRAYIPDDIDLPGLDMKTGVRQEIRILS
jgi:hypothetical protein